MTPGSIALATAYPDLPARVADPPPLRPPRQALPPDQWPPYVPWAVGGLAIAALALGLAWWRWRRTRVVTAAPAWIRERAALTALVGQAEEPPVLSQAAYHLRRFVQFHYGLGGESLTTEELERRLAERTAWPRDLQTDLLQLLRECDLLKFAPASPDGPARLVARMVALADQVDARVRAAESPPPPMDDSTTSASPAQPGRQPVSHR